MSIYRLLIVDNEEYVVDGLVELFHPERHPELEAAGVYSAAEALNALMSAPVDIVLTDIRMPGMNGLELHKIIASKWPYCKVIFLSGYDDFGYAQEAIRNGSVNYILKTEDDEVIIDAVYAAIDAIKAEKEERQVLAEARQQVKRALAALQREFFDSLLVGDNQVYASLERQLEELQIPLQPDKPLFAVVCQADEWPKEHTHFDRSLLLYAVQNIADEYLSLSMSHYSFIYERSKIVWLIQSKADPWIESVQRAGTLNMTARFVYGTFECIQSSCRELLQLPLSFAIGSGPVEWRGVGRQAERLRGRLSASAKRQQLLLEDAEDGGAAQLSPPPFRRDMFKQYEHLHYCLEHRGKEEFDRLLEELLEQGGRSLQAGHRVAALQIASTVYSLLLGAAEKLPAAEVEERARPVRERLETGGCEDWNGLGEGLRALSEYVFAQYSPAAEQEENRVVQSIHAYLAANLGGDMSLKTMAMAIGHNPSYLSRLYKQKAGKALSDTIGEMRLAKAKELLAEPRYRIVDVSRAVGFLSEHYFYRFFKKATGRTPQEFRDALHVNERQEDR